MTHGESVPREFNRWRDDTRPGKEAVGRVEIFKGAEFAGDGAEETSQDGISFGIRVKGQSAWEKDG